MTALNRGLIIGWVISLALGLIAAFYLHRRYVRLQQRTLRAERLAELGTLTGGLAHEIKNPLSTVQLNLQLLQEDLDQTNPAYARISARLNTVHRETSRLRDIVDDFLRYAGKLELARQPVELNQLLEELVDFFSPQAQLQRVQLRLRRSDAPITVQADPRLLKQAVLNLMINALQAMGDRGGELMLIPATASREATIDVIDTGSGMPAEAIAHIFDAYYSTRRGGTGLGLAITQRIAQEHGGRITVTSEEGKGSDFRLHLPM